MVQRLQNQKPIDIYDYDSRIRRVYNLMQGELSQNNSKLISDYNKMMVSISLSKATRLRHLQTLLSLSRLLGKDWNDCTRKDIDELAFKIMARYGDGNGQETHSSFDHKKILKIFFRWFKLGSRDYKEVGDPIETKSIKLRRVKDNLARESLVTQDDLTKLLKACGENLRDRALIDVQGEAGTRPGELLSLFIKHVKFDNYGAIIHVDGKTGPRPVRLIRATPSLAGWLNVHPFRDNPNSPLWIKTDNRGYGEMLTYSGARMVIKRRCEMAQLPKRVWLNLFRHSEATETAKFMTEAELKTRHGWSRNSRMPGRYTHLVSADVDEKMLSHYGLKRAEASDIKSPKICTICKMVNPHDSKLCTQCGKPLDLQTALEEEQKLLADQEKKRIEMEKITKRIDDLEYGAEAREAVYAKNMWKFGQEKNRSGEVISMLWHFLFERMGTEEEKRRFLKRAKKATENREKFDMSWFKEFKRLNLENLKGIRNIA